MKLQRVRGSITRRRASRLIEHGRLDEAIELLTRAVRKHRDAALETLLVELRRDSLPSVERRVPHPVGGVADLFPDVVGIPEISGDDLTIEALTSAIVHHGSLLVRGLVAPRHVERLVRDIDEAFAAYDQHVAGVPTAETMPYFVPFEPGPEHPIHREWIRNGDGVLAVDSPRALFDIIETFDEIGLRELITEFVGEPALILALKTTLRRVKPLGDPDWHQDGAFMGGDIRSLDVWLALSDCGEDAASLDVVGRRLDEIVTTGTDGARFDWSVGPAKVEALAPEGVVRPVFAPGDALLFDHFMLHRTGVHDGMTRDRYAVEAWFAAPSSYPADQVGIAY